MKKIGILGGSFDPVHEGHIFIARCALKAMQLDEVWFLPTVATPLKERQLTDFPLRVQMLRMALQGYRKLRISLIETYNTVPSYSINTARNLHKFYPGNQFYWILGTDQLEQLDKWKDIEELRKLVTFICVARHETPDSDKAIVIRPEKVHPASSTAIRNGDFTYLPKRLRSFVMEKGLYADSILEHNLKPKRLAHVKSVAETAVKMARGNGVNEFKAWLAGMYHDIAKEKDKDELAVIMKAYYPQHADLNYHTWHQYCGEYYLKHYYGLRDKEVLKAVKHHCLGDGYDKLSKIIYCADKLEPTRGYDSSREIELCCRDIEAGYRLVKQQQQDFLQKEGVL